MTDWHELRRSGVAAPADACPASRRSSKPEAHLRRIARIRCSSAGFAAGRSGSSSHSRPIFALSFVFLGVGAGGSGVGDYLADLFGSGPSTDTPSVSDARAKVEDESRTTSRLGASSPPRSRPKDRSPAAIPHLERFTEGRPEDADALSTLAALYGTRAQEQQAELAAGSGRRFGVGLLVGDHRPLEPARRKLLGADHTARTGEDRHSRQRAHPRDDVDLHEAGRHLGAPHGASARRGEPLPSARAGEFFAGATDEAITAWEEFLELAPDDPNAPLVRRQSRALKANAPPDGG